MKMNASKKCTYSRKYLPLVNKIKRELTTIGADNNPVLDEVNFKLKLIELFEDGATVFENMKSGTGNGATSSLKSDQKPVEIVTGRGERYTNISEDAGINAFYVANDGSRRLMEYEFKRNVTGKAVVAIDPKTNSWTWVNPNENIGGYSGINSRLFYYKIELLKDLASGIDVTLSEDSLPNINDAEALEAMINDLSKQLKSRIDAKQEVSDKAYDAFVILTNFDKLIDQLTPFIAIKKGKEDLTTNDKYEYVGPNVKHFHNFTSGKNADFAPSEEQVSDLAKILLQIIPEVSIDPNNQTEIINPNTSIGVAGFDSAMTALKSSLLNGSLLREAISYWKGTTHNFDENTDPRVANLKELINSYNSGLQIKLGELIDVYIETIGNKAFNKNDKHRTYLVSKLRAIRKFICDSKTPASIKNMFYAQFFKTELITYRGYQTERGSGTFKGASLQANYVNTQKYFLQDMVNGAVSKIKRNPEFVKDLKEAYNISIDTKEKTITLSNGNNFMEISYDYNPYTHAFKDFEVSGNFSDKFLNGAVLDILSYIIPDTYETCAPLKAGDSRAEHFGHLIAMTLLASQKSFGAKVNAALHVDNNGRLTLNDIADVRDDMANRLSIMYGSETKNVIKSPTGSKLPLYQLTCLNYNVHSLIYDFEQRESKGKYDSAYSNNLLYLNKGLLGRSQIRSEVVLNGQEKSVGALNTKELLQIAIIDDFWSTLDSGKIYLQNATFADKGTHFLQEYNIDQEVTINTDSGPKTFNLKALIKSLANATTLAEVEAKREEISEIIRELRKNKINTVVSNIIEDYETVFGTDVLYKTTTELSDAEKIKKVDEFLRNSTVATLRTFLLSKNISFNENDKETDLIKKAFWAAGVNIYEEVHYYSPKNNTFGGIRFNETIANWHKVFNSKEEWRKRVLTNRAQFINFLNGGEDPTAQLRMNMHQDPRVKALKPDTKSKDFADMVESNSGDLWFAKGNKMLPIVEAFFMADMLLSNEFNSLTIGEVYCHPNKAKSKNEIQVAIDYKSISDITSDFNVIIDNNLIYNYKKWLDTNPTGIVAYRVRNNFNTEEAVNKGIIENPFNWKTYGTEKACEMFLNWLLTGNNYGETNATNEFRNAIINRILNSDENTPILYYKELRAPSHATIIGYLIKNKNLILDPPIEYNSEYIEFSEANRLIAQIKRSVIFGATIHPFMQNVIDDNGINRGVAKNIDIAVIKDMEGMVWNIIGDEAGVDSMDGSGLQLQIQSRLENNSLLDARVGDENKKTILADNDPRYGRPTLLKWAVYALTNELRRKSFMSKASGESLVKKMMSKVFNSIIDYNTEYQNYGKKIVFKDYTSGKYFRIDSIVKTDSGFQRNLTEINPNTGASKGQSFVDSTIFAGNTLYDIDVMFGGAWAGEIINGKFQYTDANNDMLEDIVCKYNLKDKFIAYAVNKSAIKVGAGNVNADKVFTDPNEALQTISMSTKYGGVQMNADHHLDEAEVTEMTQMISALIEDGHYSDVVNEIYTDIGQILQEKLKGFIKEVNDPARKIELYQRLAASLISSFEGDSKSTIGLAQAFVKKASRSLREGNFDFKLPFSAATINGAFIADVAATINKKGIRHKYEGFAGVLNPSYNMVQFYRIATDSGYKTMFFEEFADYVANKGWSLDRINELSEENPFVKTATKLSDIDIESTVVVENLKTGEKETITLDSFENYDKVVNKIGLNPEYKIWILNGTPRNLRQGSTEFKVEINGVPTQFNLYNLDTVRAAYYLRKGSDKKKGVKWLAKGDNQYWFDWAQSIANRYSKKKTIVVSTDTIFETSVSSDYRTRTEENARLADTTLIFASNPYSSGTILTKKAAGDKAFTFYVPKGTENINDCIEDNVNNFIKKLKGMHLFDQSISINIAGNRMSIFEKSEVEGWKTQEELDSFIQKVILSLQEKGVKIKQIRSGGQSGADEAGIKAARNLGIPSVVRGTSDWKFEKKNKTTKSEVEFKRRFSKLPKNQGVSIEVSDNLSIDDKIKLLSDETQRITKSFDYAIKEKEEIERGIRTDYTPRSEFDASHIFGLPEGTKVRVISHWMRPHEIITGRYQWEKLGLGVNDNMADIEERKSDYFLDILKSKHGAVPVNKDLYDIVLYKNGVPYLVKFGDINSDNISLSTDFIINDNKVGEDDNVLFDGKYICSSEGKKFLKTTVNGVEYNIITVDSQEAYDDLLSSHIFSKFVRKNFTDKNKAKIIEYTDGDEDVKLSASALNKAEETNMENKFQELAEDQYDSFHQLQYYIGARIPTQAMQSFMPMKVVAVTDCATNQVYVPRSQTWLEGSDYDIDKLYILVHSLDDNGCIQVGSALQRNYPLSFVSKLSKPNGITYSEGPDGYILSKKVVEDIYAFRIKNAGERDAIAKTLNNIFKSGFNTITFEDPGYKEGSKEALTYKRAKEKVLKMLNAHSLTKQKIINNENAIKNRVVNKTLDITRAPQNQRSSFIPINMDEQQAAAKRSTLGNTEKHLTSDNAAAKFLMQEQNMIGKTVIGITAVSLKTFFGLSAYYNSKIENALLDFRTLRKTDPNAAIESLLNNLSGLLISNPITLKKTVLSNLDIERIMDILMYDENLDLTAIRPLELGSVDPFNEGSNNNLLESLEILKRRSSRTDAALVISGLLSAATDNAKELILAKINATPELVDVYTYLAMIGMTFDEIANIMTSSEFNELTSIATMNIFDSSTYGYKVKKSVGFMLGADLIKGLNKGMVYGICLNANVKKAIGDHLLETTKNGEKKLTINCVPRILKDSKALEAIMNYVLKSINAGKAPEGENFDSDSENDGKESKYVRYADLNTKERLDVYRALERCKRRNDFFAKSSPESLQKIALIISGTEEMSALGGGLGINQGTKTDAYDQYSFVKRIENTVNDKIKIYNKAAEKAKQPLLDQFNFLEFISKPREEQLSTIETYERVLKTSFNILDVLTTVPHFAQMIKMTAALNKALSTLSVKYRTIMNLVDKVCVATQNTSLGRDEFKELDRYLGDKLIVEYLLAPENKEMLTFKLPKGQLYYTGLASTTRVEAEEGHTLTFNNIWDLASFKRYMEDHVIPTLQKENKSLEEGKQNQFIRMLTFVDEPEDFRGQKRTYYKLPLNMGTARDSVNTEAIYNSAVAGLKALSKDSFEGHNIADLFYLYNMIINKDSFGDHALTTLFEDLIDDDNLTNSIINRFNAYIADLDFGEDFISTSVDEAIYRIAKYVQGTRIENISNRGTFDNLSEDFPIDLPFTFEVAEGKVNPVPIKIGTVTPSELIAELANQVNELVGAKTPEERVIIMIDSSDFDKNFSDLDLVNFPGAKDLKSFIHNGKVYINTDHFKSGDEGILLHELSHILFAQIKYSVLTSKKAEDIETFANLISSIENSDAYRKYSTPYKEIFGDIGSDIAEEVFCKKSEEVLAGLEGEDFKNKLLSVAKEMLGKIDPTFINDTLVLSQKMRTLKTALAKDEVEGYNLKQDCYVLF